MLKAPPAVFKKLLSFANKTCPMEGTTTIAQTGDIADLVAQSARCFSTNALTTRQARYSITKGNSIVLLHRSKRGELTSSCLIEFYPKQVRAYLNAVCVEFSYRGRGLGRWYMTLFEKAAALTGCHTLTSTAAVDNEASLRLHLNCGFIVTGQQDDYYDDGRAACHMRKNIRES